MRIKKTTTQLLTSLVEAEVRLKRLPPLTSLQKTKLDHSRAIDHLYYSSKIEGTNLNDKRLERAIDNHAAAAPSK